MASPSGEWAWMAEVAGEELAKLEAAHPSSFAPLKAELKRLIADPALPDAAAAAAAVLPLDVSPAASTSSGQSAPSALRLVSTQESCSTNRKRRWGAGEREGKRRKSGGAAAASAAGGRKDRAEMAIERAERCLRRIRAIKESLLGFMD